MAFPAWFENAPAMRLHDGLAELLGAPADGILDYRYPDAVRLAGHSCPTVAGAYLAACAGLKALYGDAMPERGQIAVTLPDAEDAGVTGVIGQVMTLVTGAAAANGFHGLGGDHVRAGLLRYGDAGVKGVRMQRRDTGAMVEVDVDASTIQGHPKQRMLLAAIVQGQADDAQRREFGELWQDRVRRLLTVHADDPAVVTVRRIA
ncbi:hypothetical protein DCD74_09080 [Lysobacter oculi]|uniref:Formylmethanofuran dehydrogenase subunit E domain-containing protein n=1 Tax=Solilutibacter oculi TaxID=2698682 RepID=A0A344J705_9GAMM|nr:FmdE family protein [Lysobacter oculi]AXA84815.1 hypothetical protein DCD74_09080 [Lysobacter oculi]